MSDKEEIIDRYHYLHEKQGIGFPKEANKGYGMTHVFIKKDGSIYIDAIPVLTEKEYTLSNLALGLSVTISEYFHAYNPDGTFLYGSRPRLFYKH